MAERVASALSPANGSRIFLVTTGEKFSLHESLRAAQAFARDLPELRITDIVLNRALAPSPAQIAPHKSQMDCGFCNKRVAQTQKAKVFLQRNFKGVPVRVAGDSAAPVLGAAALARFGAHIFDAKPLPPTPAPPKSGGELRIREVGWPELKVPLVLTLGKGGVGKTTVSAALAFHQCQIHKRRKVIVASTDPAPSLDDVFAQPIGDEPKPVLGKSRLKAVEFDSLRQFQLWATETKQKIESAFSNQGRGVHVDLSFDRQILTALLDIIPPGVDEILAIFRVLDLLDSSPARHPKEAPQIVVIDMAPTGHALELLRMPERLLLWAGLTLKALAPHRSLALAQDLAVEIAQLSQRVRTLRDLLKDKQRCQAIPVMLAEVLPDRETARLLQALAQMSLNAPVVIVNRVFISEEASECLHCRMAASWQRSTLAGLQKKMRGKVLYLAPNRDREIAGGKGLQSFTRRLWQLESHPRARARK